MNNIFRKIKSRVLALLALPEKQEQKLLKIERQLESQSLTQQEQGELLKQVQFSLDTLSQKNGQNQANTTDVLQKVNGLHDLTRQSHHFSRNFLPNDDSALQKTLCAIWSLNQSEPLNNSHFQQSAFRCFSQNDEDGILLRLFSRIGVTNRCVIEIGSNCSGSEVGIPENISTNLIINHGWHGILIEMDENECNRMRYFFARDHATRHYHWKHNQENTYYSPVITQQAVTSDNINELLRSANSVADPDLMIIDIDGGDYEVVKNLSAVKPKVLVVEFEKRFRENYSVVQFDRRYFSQAWEQSGAASLAAWIKLLKTFGYVLCAVSSSGFNAFFVKSDLAEIKKINLLTAAEAFDTHPIFSNMRKEYWVEPDETWLGV